MPVFNINVNSLITFVEPEANGSFLAYFKSYFGYLDLFSGTRLTLTDIYSRGRHLKNELLLRTYATWHPDKGFLIHDHLPPLFHKLYRGNFEKLTLRAATAVGFF
jgi:hypothetical protein